MHRFSTRLFVLLLVVTLPMSIGGCAKNQSITDTASMVGGSLLGMLGGSPDLSTLLGLVQAAGLEDMLGGANPLTLLAPSNEAFAKLGSDALGNLTDPGNKDMLTNMLNNHVIEGSLSAADLGGAASQTSALGSALDVVKGDGGALQVGGANVTESMEGSNGFIHVIDKVLMP